MKTIINFRNVSFLLLGLLFAVSCNESDSDLNPEQISKSRPEGAIVVTDEPEFSMSLDGDLSFEEAKAQYEAAYREFKSKNNIAAGRTNEQGDIKLGIMVKTGTRAGGTCLNAELWWTVWVNNTYFEGIIPNNPMTATPGWHAMTLKINPPVGSFAWISHGELWHIGPDSWDVRGYNAWITAEGGIGASSFGQAFNTFIPASSRWTELRTVRNIGTGVVDVYPGE